MSIAERFRKVIDALPGYAMVDQAEKYRWYQQCQPYIKILNSNFAEQINELSNFQIEPGQSLTPIIDLEPITDNETGEQIGISFIKDKYGATHVRHRRYVPNKEDASIVDVSAIHVIVGTNGVSLITRSVDEPSPLDRQHRNFGTTDFIPTMRVVSNDTEMLASLAEASSLLDRYRSLADQIAPPATA